MLRIKLKKMTFLLSLCVISVLSLPTITQAASETGSLAARQAADQKAALAKKALDKQKALEEKQKTKEQNEKIIEKPNGSL